MQRVAVALGPVWGLPYAIFNLVSDKHILRPVATKVVGVSHIDINFENWPNSSWQQELKTGQLSKEELRLWEGKGSIAYTTDITI